MIQVGIPNSEGKFIMSCILLIATLFIWVLILTGNRGSVSTKG